MFNYPLVIELVEDRGVGFQVLWNGMKGIRVDESWVGEELLKAFELQNELFDENKKFSDHQFIYLCGG